MWPNMPGTNTSSYDVNRGVIIQLNLAAININISVMIPMANCVNWIGQLYGDNIICY